MMNYIGIEYISKVERMGVLFCFSCEVLPELESEVQLNASFGWYWSWAINITLWGPVQNENM